MGRTLHLCHILQHSHPGQLLLDQPEVVNFLPKLGTISSMIHLEESTCVPLWFSRPPRRAAGLGFGHSQGEFSVG